VVQHPSLTARAVDAFAQRAGGVPSQRGPGLAVWDAVDLDVAEVNALAEACQVDAALVPPQARLRDYRLLAFDMDSTLITIECVDEIADFAGRKAEVAAITGDALDARRADVWLLSEGEWFLAATCSRADSQPPPRPQDADGHVELRHGQGDSAQVLGAVSVLTANGGPLRTTEAQLLEALAAQAVLVVRAVGLSAERKARLSVISRQKEELQSARLRTLTAADTEQRRLQRDLADGPLGHLDVIAAGLPRLLFRPDTLANLRRHADAAIEVMRDLARGVYPPVLRDSGLVPALEARYRHSPAPVTVHGAMGDGRLPQETELTAYLATCDAVAAALSGAARIITLELTRTSDTLVVTVRDDGEPVDSARRADLQIAADRAVAAGGSFQLDSAPGDRSGSVLQMILPVRADQPEP